MTVKVCYLAKIFPLGQKLYLSYHELMDALEIDLEFLQSFASPHTRRAYKSDLRAFICFLKTFYEGASNFKNVTRAMIIHYRNWLSDCGGPTGEPMAPKSIARKMASIDSYFDFLIEHRSEQGIEMNPTSSVKRPKQEVRSPTQAVSRNLVLEMIDHASMNPTSGPLHHALMVTYFMTGLRTSEILALKIKDMIFLNNQVYFRLVGKGGKIHHKQLMPKVLEAIEAYLEWMKGLGRSVAPEEWLFRPTKNPADPKNIDRPISPSAVNELFSKYALMSGVKGNVSAHSARATFITDYLSQGADLKEVAMEVGHASTTTTEIYDKRRKKLTVNLAQKLGY